MILRKGIAATAAAFLVFTCIRFPALTGSADTGVQPEQPLSFSSGTESENQLWRFEPADDNVSPKYYLQNVDSRQYLMIEDGELTAGTVNEQNVPAVFSVSGDKNGYTIGCQSMYLNAENDLAVLGVDKTVFEVISFDSGQVSSLRSAGTYGIRVKGSDLFFTDASGSYYTLSSNADVYSSAATQKWHIDTAEVINGEQYYIVGHTIERGGQIIGYVFATTPTGINALTSDIVKIFALSAVICLSLAYVGVYFITKHMTDPLLQMSKAAKQFANGDFSYRVKVNSRDELADLAGTFNEMAGALDKLENSRRSFVANVSHELKTPMTSIAGFIDGILDGTIPKEKEKHYLQIVSDEVRRLSRLVVAMLNMSKIESGDFVMNRRNYDIAEQIINVLLNFEQKIEQKNIEIFGLDKLQPTRIDADPDMIYQVIYNLVDNAVKFTNVDGYIAVTLKTGERTVTVSIKNSGDGIRQEELSKIFERFYKVDKSRSLDAKGAGLGLYIVKTMVELHGGKIWAKSDEPKSAEFTFTLPQKAANKQLKE